jgi:hypothetical protein
MKPREFITLLGAAARCALAARAEQPKPRRVGVPQAQPERPSAPGE